MSNLSGDGDLTGVKEDDLKPRSRPPALASGWYKGQITGSEYKNNNARTGRVLHLELRVHGEPNYLRDFLNLRNPNVEAQRIARATLKKIVLAVKHEDPSNVVDSIMLHKRDLMIHVQKVQTGSQYADDEGYENEVSDYKGVEGEDLGTPANDQSSAPNSAAAEPADLASGMPF